MKRGQLSKGVRYLLEEKKGARVKVQRIIIRGENVPRFSPEKRHSPVMKKRRFRKWEIGIC